MKNQLITTALAAMLLAACSSGVGKAPAYEGNVEGAENVAEGAPPSAKEDESVPPSVSVLPGSNTPATGTTTTTKVTVGPQCVKYFECCPAAAKATGGSEASCTDNKNAVTSGTQASADAAEEICKKSYDSLSKAGYCD